MVGGAGWSGEREASNANSGRQVQSGGGTRSSDDEFDVQYVAGLETLGMYGLIVQNGVSDMDRTVEGGKRLGVSRNVPVTGECNCIPESCLS